FVGERGGIGDGHQGLRDSPPVLRCDQLVCRMPQQRPAEPRYLPVETDRCIHEGGGAEIVSDHESPIPFGLSLSKPCSSLAKVKKSRASTGSARTEFKCKLIRVVWLRDTFAATRRWVSARGRPHNAKRSSRCSWGHPGAWHRV